MIQAQIGPMTDLPSRGITFFGGLVKRTQIEAYDCNPNWAHDRPAQQGDCAFLASREKAADRGTDSKLSDQSPDSNADSARFILKVPLDFKGTPPILMGQSCMRIQRFHVLLQF